METLQHWENDALLVDDLLDFSSGDIGEGEECMVTCIRREEEKNSSCLKNSAEICSSQGTIARASQELSEAGDPLFSLAGAEWDWLSSFVEESYKSADNSLAVVTSEEWLSSRGGRKEGHAFTPIIAAGVDGKRPSTTSWLRMGASSQILDVGSSPLIETAPAQHSGSSWRREWDKRSRSKRCSRSGGRVWSLQRVMVRATEEDDDQEASSLDYEPYPSFNSCSRKASTMQEGRRCSHCQVQKTPQWRRGPFGPKTLCNACGVRYKSGRLLPEYRPAASPTFVSELHSNSHRRVLEMRTFKSCVAQEPHHDEFSSCSQESSL